MSLFLDKLLAIFVYPLGAALLFGSVALALSFTRYRKLARFVLALTVIGLWIAATPLFSHWLVAQLEAQYPPQPIANLPEVDAVILLGGFLQQPLPSRLSPDLTAAADRALEAVRLYKAGKAPRILVAAGTLFWQPAVAPEAELIADLLVELGVPRSDLVLETQSQNTHENAINAARIFAANGWATGLLVTSGAHMPRALAAFRRAGLNVAPAATDVDALTTDVGGVFRFLPAADALERTTTAVKEIVGGLVYRSRGWE